MEQKETKEETKIPSEVINTKQDETKIPSEVINMKQNETKITPEVISKKTTGRNKKKEETTERNMKRSRFFGLSLFPEPKKETCKLLLFGTAGSGKSTIANVLLNRNNTFKEVFPISSSSGTQSIQVEKTDIGRLELTIIDTIGMGNASLTNQEVLRKLAEIVNYIGDGLKQIFLVTDRSFTEEEVKVYDLLRSTIFDDEVIKYTTIIRTNFPEFEDEEECEANRKKLREKNQIIPDSMKIIYVDNPPMNDRYVNVSMEVRKKSRTRLLKYLETCRATYRPSNLGTLNERINMKYNEQGPQISNIRQKINNLQEQINKLGLEVEESEFELAKQLQENSKLKRGIERERENKAEVSNAIQYIRNQLENLKKTSKKQSETITRLERENQELKTEIKNMEADFSLSSGTITQLKKENQELKTGIKNMKRNSFITQIQTKKDELEKLITTAGDKSEETNYLLRNLLKKQKKISQRGHSFTSSKMEEIKEILVKKLNKEEIQTVIDKQTEIINLEKQLKNSEDDVDTKSFDQNQEFDDIICEPFEKKEEI